MFLGSFSRAGPPVFIRSFTGEVRSFKPPSSAPLGLLRARCRTKHAEPDAYPGIPSNAASKLELSAKLLRSKRRPF